MAPPQPDRAPVRIGSVPYLNSKVLIGGLETNGFTPGGTPYTLELLPPSPLAARLHDGALDVALVSSVEFFRHPDYTLVPGCAVCGEGEMWSIRLFHKKPLHELRRIALDPASETTNTLLRIVLAEGLGLTPVFETPARGVDPRTLDVDGFLLIGDAALQFNDNAYQSQDLLNLWERMTGLPFVFAAWLVRGGADLHDVGGALREAKATGLKQIDAIARAYGTELDLPIDTAHAYISSIVKYDLGAREQEGLARFGEYLEKLQLIERTRPLAFYGA